MFEGFTHTNLTANGVGINLRYGGSGPPLLLLHGYPQTHVMWHKVAPALAERLHRRGTRHAGVRGQRQAARTGR